MVHSFTVSEEHLSNNRHSKKLKTLEPLHIEKTKQFFFAQLLEEPSYIYLKLNEAQSRKQRNTKAKKNTMRCYKKKSAKRITNKNTI